MILENNMSLPKLILVNIVLRADNGEIRDPSQLGLLYIGTVAFDAGYSVEILTGENLIGKISRSIYDGEALLGFYTNSDNIKEVFRTCHYIKKQFPYVKIILGGPLANADSENLITDSSVDFVGRGDGEFLVLELLKEIASGGNEYHLIDGLTYMESDKILTNRPREVNKKLDDLPIPNRSLDIERARISPAMLSTSRGCGFKCTFCYESTNRQYRYNSPKHVVNEMKYLKENFGIKYFSFADDIFTTHQKRLVDICDLMRKEFIPGVDLHWFCEARVDTLSRHPYLIDEMKKSGLVRIQIGVESGDQDVINLYKKEITLDEVRNTVQKLNDVGVLSIYTNFIIGGANETNDSFAKSLSFMKELMYMAPGRMECGTCYLSPYPGTDIRNRPDFYNVKLIDEEMVTATSLGGIFVETCELNSEQIKQQKISFVQSLYSSMADIATKIEISLIREHLIARKDGMATAWSDYFISDSILGAWYQFLISENYSFDKIENDKNIDFLLPVRCFSNESMVENQLFWKIRGINLEFTEMEYFIVSHCSGKLSVFEIAERTYKIYGHKNISFETFLFDIISYLNELTSEHLIINRRLG